VHGFLLKKNDLMLNFEKKILSLGWVQTKLSEIVFSQYKIMLHLGKNIYTLAKQKCCARYEKGQRSEVQMSVT
jgi:dephospho-CoA kinase